MVKSPVLIIVIGVCAAAAVGLWLSQRTPTTPVATDPVPAPHSSDDRKRAKDFFGAPQKYDMTNGQEMRPRW